jgi:predicted amidohydrolase YtcJ
VDTDQTSVFIAPVVTMDPARPHADAFAVRGDRIIAVGSIDDVRAAAPHAVEHVLAGAVLPGLIDAHLHMQRAGLKALDHLADDGDVTDYIAAMRDSFDDDGPLDPPFDDRVRGLERVQPLLHALGITGVIDPAVTPDELRGYQAAHHRGLLSMRVVAMPYLEIGSADVGDVDDVIARLDGIGLSTGFGDERLKIGPIKVYADGEALAGQALLERPWDDTATVGLQRISEAELHRLVDWCAANGWGVGTHAVGGGAVAMVTGAYAAAAVRSSDSVRRNRFQLIHAYLEPSPDSMAAAAEIGVIASLQPSIIWHNAEGLRARIGARAERANPMRSWLDAGVVVALGSDGPFFSFDPRHLMWQVVTRRVAGDGPPLSLDEAVTVADALAAYTVGAAYASAAEHERGMIRAGMLADWAQWTADPLKAPIDELRELRVVRTDVGGRTVYRAPGGAAADPK